MTPDREIETWDLFISHASEDKDTFVRPLASSLERFGIRVWYDEYTLSLGDSLSRSIDQGLARSDYGLVILSPAFIAKKWPEYELRGLTAREMAGTKIILPVWHEITHEEVLRFSPPLADKLAVRSDQATPIQIAVKIIKAIKPELFTRVLRRMSHYNFLDTAAVTQVPLAKIKPSPIQHETLSIELVSRIRLIRASLIEVAPHSMSHWIDGFRRDAHPSTEIAHWEHVAAVYLEYLATAQQSTIDKRKKVYNFISSLWLVSKEEDLSKIAKDIPALTVESVMNIYRSAEPLYDIEEGSIFADVDDPPINKSDKYDTESFPKDFPEDLIRELMKLEQSEPNKSH